MDLITADPASVPVASSSSTTSTSTTAAAPASATEPQHVSTKTTLGEKKSKRAALMLIQNDTISVAKAALNPVRTNVITHQKQKKAVSYAQLARSIHELAATSDQKSSQKQLVHHVFPKLAMYNSVDPSLAPSLLMLDQQCEDRTVLRYVYYYLDQNFSRYRFSGSKSRWWDSHSELGCFG